MSVGEPGADGHPDKSLPGEPPARPGIWQSTKRLLVRSDAEVSYFKGLTFVGLLSTLIVAYFQYLSAYHDKVTAMAKDDMTFATDTFTQTSNALSTAIILEDQLFYNFKHAAALKASGDANALTSKEAHDLYTAYESAATALRQNGNLLARKVEIYLDWASDPNHDPANNDTLGADPISTSLLGAVDFDCDQDMPSFDKKDHVISKKKDGKTVDIDWYSAKHHVLTIEYCFDVTQKTWMEIVRQWASQSSTDPDQIAQFAASKTAVQLEERLSKEVVRLNNYMIRAMSEIEQIRVKYRPNGFVCSVPGVGQFLSLFHRCAPIHTAGP
jgi:hypothetical protein